MNYEPNLTLDEMMRVKDVLNEIFRLTKEYKFNRKMISYLIYIMLESSKKADEACRK